MRRRDEDGLGAHGARKTRAGRQGQEDKGGKTRAGRQGQEDKTRAGASCVMKDTELEKL